ncbi:MULTISPECIES: hypothetical protein [Oceanobacillus]|uniref:Lipoprotein n=2 Tax=Oceanobacillus TaxID=182709 RepID=A0A417YKS0_9BACI|nr:hypothetical protein [Oceanobacillus profundus]MBR3120424.1 hypothetical protein [Oceanobacillus sp.]MDO6449826.1 hypothetical protein [Oceanobacillus profundus]PAE30228.1 hypothetical protein CHI07_05280 [Paenibacillus sp. 7884-2]RHW33822.1 hypothetical protein D1B32_07200 [Oceanobacillus profundus]
MYKKSFVLYVGFVILLTACGNDLSMEPADNNEKIDLTKISNETLISQQPSNKAKDLLRKHDEIITVKAVNTDETMLIAIEIEHMKRLELAKIQKQYQKEMKKQFKDLDVELSTDKKIIIELNKLEKQIINAEIQNKELKKKLKQIVKLSKEQT